MSDGLRTGGFEWRHCGERKLSGGGNAKSAVLIDGKIEANKRGLKDSEINYYSKDGTQTTTQEASVSGGGNVSYSNETVANMSSGKVISETREGSAGLDVVGPLGFNTSISHTTNSDGSTSTTIKLYFSVGASGGAILMGSGEAQAGYKLTYTTNKAKE